MGRLLLPLPRLDGGQEKGTSTPLSTRLSPRPQDNFYTRIRGVFLSIRDVTLLLSFFIFVSFFSFIFILQYLGVRDELVPQDDSLGAYLAHPAVTPAHHVDITTYYAGVTQTYLQDGSASHSTLILLSTLLASKG
jgi:hypothetical protein